MRLGWRERVSRQCSYDYCLHVSAVRAQRERLLVR
jgi:hypothetical protein